MTTVQFGADIAQKEKNGLAHSSQETQNITSTPTTVFHKCGAFFISIILIFMSLIAYPYATVGGLIEPAFAATFSILIIFTALMTAYLLFGQFHSTRVPSMAVLAAVYLYVGLINIPYLLTLPNVFERTGLFNAGFYAPNWLWIFWQTVYPCGILLYISIEKRCYMQQFSRRMTNRFLLLILLAIPLLVILCAIIAIDPYHVLPGILVVNPPPIFTPVINILVMGLNGFMCVCALLLLRSRHILHLWLRVSTLASFINVSFTLFTQGRYSVGWYAGRISGSMAAIFVFCALLYEVNKLYARMVVHNEELARQNRIQRDFLAVVGHEFRTSLTTILGFSGVMREKDITAQEVREYSGDIYSDALRLTRLITNLLDLERMQSGQILMNCEPVEINVLIREVMKRFVSTAHADQIHCELDRRIPPFQADRDKLTQVIVNLLNNALKYSPEGGDILLWDKLEGDTIHLCIQDHGIGIPSEKLDEIFERYARVESSTTRYIGGTGLGLPIVRQIVTMHHGNVWAESTVGKGAAFHVVLPLQGSSAVRRA